MNKFLKFIFFSCLFMILPLKVSATSTDVDTEKSKDILQQEAKEYALKVLPDMLASVKSDSNFSVNIKDYNQLYIGHPYQILNIEDEKITNENSFNFAISENKDIKLILSVFYSQGEWNAMLSTDLVKELNELPETGTWMLYSENEIVYAESPNDIIILSNNKKKDVSEKDHYWKERRGLKFYNTYSKSDLIRKWESVTINTDMIYYSIFDNSTLLSYSNTRSDSSFIVNNTYNVILNMSDCKVSQNGKLICWAATVATITRYITGNHTLTAEQVCKHMEHAEEGGSFKDTIEALSLYGIIYTYTSSQLTWTTIRNNLVNKKPICLGAMCPSIAENYYHMVTVYGALSNYDTPSKYLNIWNSDTNSVATITYSNTKTIFQYDNKNWTWIATAHAY